MAHAGLIRKKTRRHFAPGICFMKEEQLNGYNVCRSRVSVRILLLL